MTDRPTNSFTIAVDDFDKTLLPTHAREPGTEAFANEVTKLLQAEYSSFGGWARIVVSDKIIQVSWREGDKEPLDLAIDHLASGEYSTGILMLRALLRQNPDDPELLYNLGIALSDIGELDEAEKTLAKAIKESPGHTNAIVGHGVALERQGRTEDAIVSLRRATESDESNPWAHRNLGACLLKVGKTEAGLEHLKRATELNPEDQQAWFGLGQAYEGLSDTEKADECYEKLIALDGHSKISELAKQRRSEIGQAEMRARVGGGVRPDAVMYCLSALQKFSAMSRAEMQQITFEIAMRGQSGFDFNDPTQKYQFKTIPGKFSGLHALSYMYVGFKFIAPDQSIGFDLSKEYEAAKALFDGDAP